MLEHGPKDFEVRVGVSVAGEQNMRTEAEFAACGNNPFHPLYHDNFAAGRGKTLVDAVNAVAIEIGELSASLFEEPL